MKIRKILAPTDLSKRSMAGVRAAIELARKSDAEVTVYHVLCLDEFIRFELTRARPLMLEKLIGKCRAELDALLACELTDLKPLSGVKTAVELGVISLGNSLLPSVRRNSLRSSITIKVLYPRHLAMDQRDRNIRVGPINTMLRGGGKFDDLWQYQIL